MKKHILSALFAASLVSILAADGHLIKAVAPFEGYEVGHFLVERNIKPEQCMMWHYNAEYGTQATYEKSVKDGRIQGFIPEDPSQPLSPLLRTNLLHRAIYDPRGINAVATLLSLDISPDKAPKCIIATIKEIEESVDCKVPTRIPPHQSAYKPSITYKQWLAQPSPSEKNDLLQEFMLRYPDTIIVINLEGNEFISRSLFQYIYSIVPTRQVICSKSRTTIPLEKMYKLTLSEPFKPTRSQPVARTPLKTPLRPGMDKSK